MSVGVYLPRAYLFRPHSLALKRYGIRIVLFIDDRHQQLMKLSDGAYEALCLLEEYDKEMFDQVKKHIRIGCFFWPNPPPSNRPCCVPTGRLYFLNLLYFPTDFPFRAHIFPITVAGFLAYQTTLAKSKGGMAHLDKVNGATILDLCRKEQLRTMLKLDQALCES